MFLIKENKEHLFFADLFKNGFFLHVDVFFANKLNPLTEEGSLFLAYLFKVSRLGYISLLIEKDELYPKPKDLDSEAEFDFEEEDLVKKIIRGSQDKSIQKYISKQVNDQPKLPICFDDNNYYLQKNYVFETKTIKNLQKLIKQTPDDLFIKEIFYKEIFKEKNLFEAQKKAVQNAFENTVSLILGGPGTGKTFVAAKLVEIFVKSLKKEKSFKIAAAAFTGKAALHLKSNICNNIKKVNMEAKTLHFLLNLREGKDISFNSNALDFDLIIVDEASMIDLKIMTLLLEKIKKGARVVFIGDPDQLPPLEGGNIFSELASSSLIVKTHLDQNMRFDNNLIMELASLIKTENIQRLDRILSEKIKFYDLKNIQDIKNKIFEFAQKYFFLHSDKELEIGRILQKINEFRILNSVKKGFLGTEALNKEIFLYLYNKTKENFFFYVPIIITKNNYQLNLCNGELGVVKFQVLRNKLSNGTAYFKDEESFKNFPLYSLRYFDYAYAISIHKSQGSEFKSAFIIIPEIYLNFGKELFYTAVTRVKENLFLASDKSFLLRLIQKKSHKKSRIIKRYLNYK